LKTEGSVVQKEIISRDPADALPNEKRYKWRLAMEAFLGWKRLIDARQAASRANEKERYRRLATLSTKAWQRYLRRWANAKAEVDLGRQNR